jgi:protease-4
MRKSRTGLAILFVLFLMVAFVLIVTALSLVLERDGEKSAWTDILEYGAKVGVVKLDGMITSSDETLKQLRKFSKKPSVKAIILRINSPGGAVAPAQEIYREIEKIKKKKPVVASIETVGASAAYYVASAANQIICSEGTITGSIGVIMLLTDLQRLIEKIGVSVSVIKAGKYKDIGSSVRPLTNEERTILETFAEEIHGQFIKDVASGRKGKIDEQTLRGIADGRFFTGQKAREMGLVDTIGNFYDAMRIAGNLAGVKGDLELVYPKKKWENYLDLFLESVSRAVARASQELRVISPAPAVQ